MTARQFLGLAVTLGCGAFGLFNLISAAVWQQVYGVRGQSGYVGLSDEPVLFWLITLMSVVCFFGLGGLGVLMVWIARREKAALHRWRPGIEDKAEVTPADDDQNKS